jgi:RNA polymerase sigma-70 factor (ECF subfamily)
VSDPDRDVVRAVRGGDRDALAHLVRRHQSRLFGLVLMMVRRPAAADEVTQDAFVRAYLHLDQYDDQRPFYPWLATIAVRLSQNWLHRHARTTEREGTTLDDAPQPSVDARALESLITGERDRQLWQTVAALPSGERTAVILYYREELSVRDIASALGVTTGTVKTLLFRARKHLRHKLEAVNAMQERQRWT